MFYIYLHYLTCLSSKIPKLIVTNHRLHQLPSTLTLSTLNMPRTTHRAALIRDLGVLLEVEAALQARDARRETDARVALPAIRTAAEDDGDFQARAVREGRLAKDLARIVLEEAGFKDLRSDVKLRTCGVELNFVATDAHGQDWAFDVSGAFTSGRAGLRRTDTLWKALGKAAVLRSAVEDLPLILMTTDAPARGSAGHRALATMRGPGQPIHDLIEILNPVDQERLRNYAASGLATR